MGVPITIYHGSARVVDEPRFGWGRRYNDFGLGFYCTEDKDVAKEWAVSSLHGGFANRYTLDTENLSVLNLNDPEYTILNWMAILAGHRLFSTKTPVAVRARRYLLERFRVNVGAYDLIYGCRADDAYFAFAQAFLNNTLTVGQLSQGIRPEKAEVQFVIKSEHAFSRIVFEGFEVAERDRYYARRKVRCERVTQRYLDALETDADGLYIKDIMRGGITNDDPRIPRNQSEQCPVCGR